MHLFRRHTLVSFSYLEGWLAKHLARKVSCDFLRVLGENNEDPRSEA